MPKFVVGNPCQNLIVADSKEIAELVTAMECFEIGDQESASVGWILNDKGKWVDPTATSK